MKIVNLTPHPIRIVNSEVREIPSSGVVRISEVTIQVGDVDGIPLVRKTYGQAEGLPEPQPDTLYIVSTMVRAAHPERTDLASPGDLVRDEQGNVIGCRNLIVNG